VTGRRVGRFALWCLLGAASISGIAVAEPLSFDVADAQLAHDPRTNEPTVGFWLTYSAPKFMEFTRTGLWRCGWMEKCSRGLSL